MSASSKNGRRGGRVQISSCTFTYIVSSCCDCDVIRKRTAVDRDSSNGWREWKSFWCVKPHAFVITLYSLHTVNLAEQEARTYRRVVISLALSILEKDSTFGVGQASGLSKDQWS